MHTQATFTDPFTDRLGLPLPHGLRDEADAMSWTAFCQTYEPTSGPLRLGQWAEIGYCAQSIGRLRIYRSTMAVSSECGVCIETSTVTASGPMLAFTAMLSDLGIRLETLNFHQLHDQAQVVTLIRGTDGAQEAWAMGRSDDSTLSALKAMTACVNRLAGHMC